MRSTSQDGLPRFRPPEQGENRWFLTDSPRSFPSAIGVGFQWRWVGVALISFSCALLACGGNSSGNGRGSPPPPPPSQIVTAPHPSFRTRYLRTDIQYNPNALQFFPPHFTAYDSAHKRFFVSNTTLNRIDVLDATTETKLGSIIVPAPWGIDVSQDGSEMYAATVFGDVYVLDPGAMQVLQRYASSKIGPQGYIATQVFVLATGELVLLGPMGGLYLDGSQNFAVWEPSTNALQVVDPGIVSPAQWSGNIGKIAVSADRTKVLVASADAGSLLQYDPSIGTGIGAQSSSIAAEILPTPDGKRIFIMGPQGGIDVYDASTLEQIGSFKAPTNVYCGALSYDGSILFAADESGNVYAFDTSTFGQKGWVASFQVLDLQNAIVPSAVDETGLLVGPMGHGVGFLDTSEINSGTKGTQFSISFLTPGFGSLTGSGSIETNYVGPALQQATMYVGNASTGMVMVGSTSLTTTAPKSNISGVADFTVTLPDKSIGMMPEDYSYGPTIVEVSTNAASGEGGAQGAIFGYGFGQQTSKVQLMIGGQTATVTEVIASASPTFPYPFPMQAVLFTVPPGNTGSSSDVTVMTSEGSATAQGAFHYVAPVQSYPLSGSSLMQGLYDSYRGVLYFTDRTQIQVFSPSSESWLPPITLPGTTPSTRLLGISLSPDGNTLAASDPGDNAIYVLNPSSPKSAKLFSSVGVQGYPYGLAVTNSGIVYFGTYAQSISPPGGLGKLDSTTGQITTFQQGTLEDGDASTRILLSPDGSQIYANEGGYSWILSTSNDSLQEGIQVSNAGNLSEELALSGDGTAILTSGMLTDSNLNVAGDLVYVDRDVWLPTAVLGQKLDLHGKLVFQPLTDGVDVLDGTTGLLRYRVTLPIQLSDVYDSLAIDNTDNLLFAITQNGIAQLNLTSLPSNSAEQRIVGLSQLANMGPQSASKTRPIRRTEWLNRPMLHYSNPGSFLNSPSHNATQVK